jgi:hypothetical protein
MFDVVGCGGESMGLLTANCPNRPTSFKIDPLVSRRGYSAAWCMGVAWAASQHFLYLRCEPHQQGSLRLGGHGIASRIAVGRCKQVVRLKTRRPGLPRAAPALNRLPSVGFLGCRARSAPGLTVL